MTRESSKQECHRENGQNACWLIVSRAVGRLDVPDFPVSRSQPMNPFTTNAALRILGLPRLCLSQFADLANPSEPDAFMAALLELAFHTRVREARFEDRKSVVYGKVVSVRVYLGFPLFIKKNNINNNN